MSKRKHSKEFRDQAVKQTLESEESIREIAAKQNNAVLESFFGTMKDKLDMSPFVTYEETKRQIFDYIEGFYNRQRIHSYFGYVSPEEFEAKRSA